MGESGYTSVSMNQKRFDKMFPKFKKYIQEYGKPSYTQWITTLAENEIDRIIKLKLLFPNLSIIKVIKNGLVIDDSKNNIAVKVVMNNNNMTCSHKGKDTNSYILYASLHSELHIV